METMVITCVLIVYNIIEYVYVSTTVLRGLKCGSRTRPAKS